MSSQKKMDAYGLGLAITLALMIKLDGAFSLLFALLFVYFAWAFARSLRHHIQGRFINFPVIPFDEGYAACLAGDASESNPYPPYSSCAHGWLKGWSKGAEELMAIEEQD